MTSVQQISVTVMFFASLREALGDAVTVEIEDGADIQALKAALKEALKTAAETNAESIDALEDPEVRVAVNQTLMTTADVRLAAGDEVAFMPPITGG